MDRELVTIFLVALAVRMAAIAILDAHHHGATTAHHEHQSIARNLAEGRGFSFEFFTPLGQPVATSQQAPLVPGLLAGLYCLLGIETSAAFLAMLLTQALFSALTAAAVVLLMRATSSLPLHTDRPPSPAAGVGPSSLTTGPPPFPRVRVGEGWVGVALMAGILAAIHPPLVAGAAHVQAVTWSVGWLALLLLATQRWRGGHLASGPVLFTIAGTLALLTEPILGGVILLLWGLVAIETAGLPGRRRWARAGTLLGSALGIALGIAPWTIRNYQVHGRLVPIKDSFFYVLWQGNNPVSRGSDKLLVEAQDSDELGGLWQPRQAHQVALRARGRAISVNVALAPDAIAQLQLLPTEIERMDLFRQWALAEIRHHPSRYLSLCLRRLGYWLWFDPTNPRSYLWHYRIGYLVLVPLALAGAWSVRHDPRPWQPLLLAGAGLSLVHVLVISSARFRIPFELLLILPAGLTLARLAAWLGALHRVPSSLFQVGTGGTPVPPIQRTFGRPAPLPVKGCPKSCPPGQTEVSGLPKKPRYSVGQTLLSGLSGQPLTDPGGDGHG